MAISYDLPAQCFLDNKNFSQVGAKAIIQWPVFALYTANPGLISGIPYGPLSTARSKPLVQVRSNP